mmetsp:Transcript_8473/g.12944  ORF Transcript_8473/g.12944 Transcript_8473/m.12944 type:complete len:223 (-) Transcript_8473:208-876(-)
MLDTFDEIQESGYLPYLRKNAQKMRNMARQMKQRVRIWKEDMISRADSKEFDWLEVTPIVPHDGFVMHYTPRWPLIVHFFSAMTCFAFSCIYHLYSSHSKKIMNFFIKFDYAGICILISGSCAPPIYYSFGCDQLSGWRLFYLCFCYGICMITLTVTMIPFFDKDEYNGFRGYMFMATGCAVALPLIHILFMVDPEYLPHFPITTWLGGGLMYGLGVFFYVT